MLFIQSQSSIQCQRVVRGEVGPNIFDIRLQNSKALQSTNMTVTVMVTFTTEATSTTDRREEE
jgi:hypothetical protein